MLVGENHVSESFSLKVALCQVYTEEWAVQENLERTLSALEEAASKNAELAITPECVIHGYADTGSEDYFRRMLEIAEPADGKTISLFRDQAKRHRMDLVVGFAERGEGDTIYNTAACIDKNGEIAYLYRKVHCRAFESIHHAGAFTPGDHFYTVDLQYGDRAVKVGTMICFDREVPESVRILRSLGAQFITCPLATSTFDMDIVPQQADNELITRCRAAENEVFIAVVNHAGRYNGGSFIVGPQGELLHKMGPDAGVDVVDVPVGLIQDHYHGNPLGWMGWGYRRPELYRQYLSGG